MRSLLIHIRGRQIDGQPLGRQRYTHGMKSGTYTFLALRHGLIGKAHDGKGRHAVRNLDLNVHGLNVDPLKGDCLNAGNHGLDIAQRGDGVTRSC